MFCMRFMLNEFDLKQCLKYQNWYQYRLIIYGNPNCLISGISYPIRNIDIIRQLLYGIYRMPQTIHAIFIGIDRYLKC